MKTKIQEDVKVAMKERNQLKLNTLRGLLSEIKRVEIDTREELSGDKITAVIQKEIKKRRDALQFAKDAGRSEHIEQNEKEIAILQNYLGEQLSSEKLHEIIAALIKEGADNLGKIMGALQKNYKGQFDGKQASEFAKQLLG